MSRRTKLAKVLGCIETTLAMALSKSDLLSNLNVFKFRDLLIEKAGDDIDELRKVLAGLVEASDALSVGEDFVLLSSAKFDADKIEVTKRVGLELILPPPGATSLTSARRT